MQNAVLRRNAGNIMTPAIRPRPVIIAKATRNEGTTYPWREDRCKVELDRVVCPPFYLTPCINERLYRCRIDL
jgi:hypothetical protein